MKLTTGTVVGNGKVDQSGMGTAGVDFTGLLSIAFK